MRFKINHSAIPISAITRKGGVDGYLGTGGYLSNLRGSSAPTWSTPAIRQEHPEENPYLSAPRFVDDLELPSIGGMIGRAWDIWGIEAVAVEHRQRLVDGLHPLTGAKVVRATKGRAEYTSIHEFVFTLPKELSLFLDRPEVAEALRLGMTRAFQDLESRAVAGGHRDPHPVAGIAGEWWLHLAGRGADGKKTREGKGGVPHVHVHACLYALAPLSNVHTHVVGRKSKRHPERERKAKATDHARIDVKRIFSNTRDGPRLESLVAETVVEHLRRSGWRLTPPPIGECPGVGLVGWTIICPDGRRPNQALVERFSPRRLQIDASRGRARSEKLTIPLKQKLAWTHQFSALHAYAVQTAPPLVGVGSGASLLRRTYQEIHYERRRHHAWIRELAGGGGSRAASAPGQDLHRQPGEAEVYRELLVPGGGRLGGPKAGRITGATDDLPGPAPVDESIRAPADCVVRADGRTVYEWALLPPGSDIDLGGADPQDRRPGTTLRLGSPGMSEGAGGRGWDATHHHSSATQRSERMRNSLRAGGTPEALPGGGAGPRGVDPGSSLESKTFDPAAGRIVIAEGHEKNRNPGPLWTQIVAYASSDAVSVGLQLPTTFVVGDRIAQISVASTIVGRERQVAGMPPDAQSISTTRGIIRLESWEASASASIPLESWPRLRNLAHRPLRALDEAHPEVGEVLINSGKNRWASLKVAAMAAVAWLVRRLGIPLAGQPKIGTAGETPVLEVTGELLPYNLTPGMLRVSDAPPTPSICGPRLGPLEDIETRERKRRLGSVRPEVGGGTVPQPKRRLPGR